MTVDEKMSMIYGRNAKSDIESPLYYVGNVPETARLGLPPLSLEDGPQGVADKLLNVTQWPSQLTVSQAWSTDLMAQWGTAMGREQKKKGTNVMLGPDVNLARVPWSGRVFETMGEDPFLASTLVSPLVRGIQAANISACVKHCQYPALSARSSLLHIFASASH
jgi:beta-glucosidase